LAFYCQNDEDDTLEFRQTFADTLLVTTKQLLEEYDIFSTGTAPDYKTSFSMMETHNVYTLNTGKKTTKIIKVPWSFRAKDGPDITDIDDSTVDNLIQRGPCMSPWHIDFMNFGSDAFMPTLCNGAVKFWFIGIESDSHLALSMFICLEKLSTSSQGSTYDRNNKLFDTFKTFVKHGQMIVVRLLPGQVITIPAGVPHAVMTCYDKTKNPEMISLLLGVNRMDDQNAILKCVGRETMDSKMADFRRYLKDIGIYKDAEERKKLKRKFTDKQIKHEATIDAKQDKKMKFQHSYRFSKTNQPRWKPVKQDNTDVSDEDNTTEAVLKKRASMVPDRLIF
jgi:hypothetical protein